MWEGRRRGIRHTRARNDLRWFDELYDLADTLDPTQMRSLFAMTFGAGDEDETRPAAASAAARASKAAPNTAKRTRASPR